MTDTSRPLRAHRRLAGLVAAAVAFALTVVMAPAGPATAGQYSSEETHSSQGRPVDVMTRNLYLGADLMPVIGALAAASQPGADPLAVPNAATATWNAVQATKPDERMGAIADEIVKADPEVVGLQEVTTWTTYDTFPPTNTGTVKYDFLELLLKALADRGVVYHEVDGATAHNFASPPIPYFKAPGVLGAVSMADRDVILRRDDVSVENAHTGQYQHIISFPTPLGVLPVKRGWGSVDVTTAKTEFRFVNSHLEAFGIPGVDAEAAPRRSGRRAARRPGRDRGGEALPTVYVGDYNSKAPSAPAYSLLVSSVGADAWLKTNPSDPGYTCCFDAEVKDPTAKLDSRIDLVVIDDQVKATWAKVIGDEVRDMTSSGLWPSDHAGVVARLIIN